MSTRSNIDLTQTGISGANLGNGNQVFSNVTNGVKLNFRTLIASGGTKLITSGNNIIISGASVGAGSGDINSGANRGSALGAGVFSVKSGTTLTFKSISSSNPALIKIITDPSNIYISGATISANVAGSNKQIQYNNNGSFGANANLTYESTGCTLTISNGASSSIGINNIINKSSIHGNYNIGIGCATICGNNNIVDVSTPFSFSGNSNIFIGIPSNSNGASFNIFNGTGSLNGSSFNVFNGSNGVFCCAGNGISLGTNNSICKQQYYDVNGCNNLLCTGLLTAQNNKIWGNSNTISTNFGGHSIIGNSNSIISSTSNVLIAGYCNKIGNSTNTSLISSSCNAITGASSCFNHTTFASVFGLNTNILPVISYDLHLITSNFAIVCTPLSGSTSNDYLLSWNPTDRKVKRLSPNSISGSGSLPAGVNQNIQFNKSNTFGADTKFNYVCSGATMTIGNTYQTHTNCSVLIGGAGSLSSTCANLNLSIGDNLLSDKTNYSLNIGSSNKICNLSTTASNYDMVFGYNNLLYHSSTVDLNHNYRTILNGCCNTIGCISRGSIINSDNSIVCYGNNRIILNSSCVNLFDNTPAAQGSHITALSLNNFCLNSLSAYNYGCHLIAGNLAIACNPLTGNTGNNILVYDNADKKVKQVAQSTIGGGGGSIANVWLVDSNAYTITTTTTKITTLVSTTISLSGNWLLEISGIVNYVNTIASTTINVIIGYTINNGGSSYYEFQELKTPTSLSITGTQLFSTFVVNSIETYANGDTIDIYAKLNNNPTSGSIELSGIKLTLIKVS